MEIEDMWTPRPTTVQDRNLMEVAITDPYFTPRRRWKLEVINNCRRYIGCFYITDIMTHGKVDKDYLDGTRQIANNSSMNEHIRKPPKQAWGEWKCFVFRNFLINGYEVFPTVGSTLNQQEFKLTSEREILQDLPPGMSLVELYNKLPNRLQVLLQDYHFPSDNGESLIVALSNGTLVGASDGSVKMNHTKQIGGYSYSLQHQNTDIGRIVGCASAPMSNSTTSLTTELFGLLATTLCTFLLWKCNEFHPAMRNKQPSLAIYSDNKEAIGKCNEEAEDLNVSDHRRPEYDIEKLVWEIKHLLPIRIAYIWVKGHQNETKTGNPIYGPFRREVCLNIEMDRLANIGCSLPRVKRPMFSATKMTFYTEDDLMITDFEKYLYEKINGEFLLQYVSEKYDIERDILNTVDWRALGTTLKSYTTFRQRKVIQMMYDWQNDGVQKQRMHDDDGVCPACGDKEEHLHYTACTDSRMLAERKKQFSILSKSMTKLDTYPGLISTIQAILIHGTEKVMQEFHFPTTETDQLLLQAITSQHQLRHDMCVKGLLTTEWEKVQQHWCNVQKLRFDPTRWTSGLIKGIQTYTLAMWAQRNVLLHGDSPSEQLEICKANCRKRVKELYKRSRRNLSLEDKKLFQLPLVYRCKGSVASMTLWIDKAEMVFQHMDQNEDNKLDTKYWIFKQNKKWLKKAPNISVRGN